MTDSAPTIVLTIDITGPGDVNCFFDIAQKLPLTNDSNLAIIKGSDWVGDQLKQYSIRYHILRYLRSKVCLMITVIIPGFSKILPKGYIW